MGSGGSGAPANRSAIALRKSVSQMMPFCKAFVESTVRILAARYFRDDNLGEGPSFVISD